MINIPRPLILGFVLIFIATLGYSQGITTGTVAGTVYDPSGAVVPGAQVELANLASGLKLEAQSGAEGAFQFFAVPIGTYKAAITAAGFSVANIDNLHVVAGATTNLNDVRLRIGASEQMVVDGSMASLLETSDSQVSATFNTETVQNLPLNNGFDTIAEVLSGVVSTGDDDFSNANGDNYSVNGQSGRYNNFEIDGQSNNDNTTGGSNAFFGNQDAIAEIQVVTNDYSAQYGRNAGAVVNYITRSGTNSFHGSAFDLYQGQFLSSLENTQKNSLLGFCPPGVSASTGCIAPVLPRYVENRAGATIGGPIYRNKLFFFFSTFWDRVRQGVSPSQSLPDLTPDAAGLATIAATFASDPGALAIAQYGPYSIQAGNPQPLPVPAGQCPAGSIQTASSMCDEIITDGSGNSATVEFAGVTRSIPSIYNDQEELARVDWQPTEKDHLFARFFYQPEMDTGYPGPDGAASGDFVDVPATTYSVGADWTHIFTSNFLDQLRYSFQESKSYFEGGAFPGCTANNFGGCPAEMYFAGTNDDLTFGGDTEFPQGRTVKVTEAQNNATWTRGAQTLLFGGEFEYQNTPEAGLFYYDGQANYSNFSNLLGAPDASYYGAPGYGILANGDVVIPFTEPDVAAYFQDDWKVTHTLTFHLGVRWEFFGQAINKLHQETVARESDPSTAFWSTALPLSDRTTPEVNSVYTNFEPRIGLAWNPEFDRKLVVRAGYAINANPEFYNLATQVAGNAPTSVEGAFYCGANACLPSSGSLLSGDFRALNLPALAGGDPGLDTEYTVPSNFRTPYVQTYTFAIDHQIGNAAVFEARYTGSKTTDDFQSVDANPDMLTVASAFPSFISPSALCSDPTADGYGRPNCNGGNVTEFTNGGWANYNGLQLNLTTQNYHGLASTVSYTWSKAMNNTTDAIASTLAGGNTLAFAQDPLNTDSAERGLSGNDFPNVVGLEFTYDVPKLIRGNGLLGRAANGFLFSGLYRYRSGQDYTPFQPLTLDANTGDTSFCDFAFNYAVPEVDTCRLVLSNKKAPIDTVAYLNPYVNGTTPYTPISGPAQYVVYNTDSFDANGNYNPGTPINPANAHWIINNQAYAMSVNNPYPGSSRSLLRGQPYSDLDLTIFKKIPINERVSLQLSTAAYNVLNQMFLGAGNPYVAASNFTSNAENTSGSVSGDTSGNRFVVLGGKVTF